MKLIRNWSYVFPFEMTGEERYCFPSLTIMYRDRTLKNTFRNINDYSIIFGLITNYFNKTREIRTQLDIEQKLLYRTYEERCGTSSENCYYKLYICVGMSIELRTLSTSASYRRSLVSNNGGHVAIVPAPTLHVPMYQQHLNCHTKRLCLSVWHWITQKITGPILQLNAGRLTLKRLTPNLTYYNTATAV